MTNKIWAAILNAEWQSLQESNIPETVKNWLREPASMTERLEKYCQRITVLPTFEGFISQQEIPSPEKVVLPDSPRYWLREIVLFGDAIPWLQGRTLIPEETLTGNEKNLLALGRIPLGRYLFNNASLSRDFIQIHQIGNQWARRSRLRLSGKPLLLTELFLTAAPIYQETLKTLPNLKNTR